MGSDKRDSASLFLVPIVKGSLFAYLRSNITLAQKLRHQPILQITKPSTFLEVRLGQEHIPQAQFLSFALQILQDRRVSAESRFGISAIGVDLLGKHCFGRDAIFFHESLYLYDVRSIVQFGGTLNSRDPASFSLVR